MEHLLEKQPGKTDFSVHTCSVRDVWVMCSAPSVIFGCVGRDGEQRLAPVDAQSPRTRQEEASKDEPSQAYWRRLMGA